MSVIIDEIAGKLPVILILRRGGFSIRAIAKCVGIPKSTLARWMPSIEQLASEIRLGLHNNLDPEIRGLIAGMSQTGHPAIESPQETKLLTYRPVPNGTNGDRQ